MDAYVSRDLDSLINAREAAAVADWWYFFYFKMMMMTMIMMMTMMMIDRYWGDDKDHWSRLQVEDTAPFSLHARPPCSLYWGVDQRKQSIKQYSILDFTHTCFWNGYVVVRSQWTILLTLLRTREKEKQLWVFARGDKNLLTNIDINIITCATILLTLLRCALRTRQNDQNLLLQGGKNLCRPR